MSQYLQIGRSSRCVLLFYRLMTPALAGHCMLSSVLLFVIGIYVLDKLCWHFCGCFV